MSPAVFISLVAFFSSLVVVALEYGRVTAGVIPVQVEFDVSNDADAVGFPAVTFAIEGLTSVDAGSVELGVVGGAVLVPDSDSPTDGDMPLAHHLLSGDSLPLDGVAALLDDVPRVDDDLELYRLLILVWQPMILRQTPLRSQL